PRPPLLPGRRWGCGHLTEIGRTVVAGNCHTAEALLLLEVSRASSSRRLPDRPGVGGQLQWALRAIRPTRAAPNCLPRYPDLRAVRIVRSEPQSGQGGVDRYACSVARVSQ